MGYMNLALFCFVVFPQIGASSRHDSKVSMGFPDAIPSRLLCYLSDPSSYPLLFTPTEVLGGLRVRVNEERE